MQSPFRVTGCPSPDSSADILIFVPEIRIATLLYTPAPSHPLHSHSPLMPSSTKVFTLRGISCKEPAAVAAAATLY